MRLDPTEEDEGIDPYARDEELVRELFGCAPPAGVAHALALLEQAATIRDDGADDIDF